jgi:transposase
MATPAVGRGPRARAKLCGSLPRLIENSMASTALVTQVVVSKFAWFSTLYRQVHILAGHGVHLDRSTVRFTDQKHQTGDHPGSDFCSTAHSPSLFAPDFTRFFRRH